VGGGSPMARRRSGLLLAMGALAFSAATGAVTEGPPTKAEAEALLAALKEAATAKDCAAILAMLDDSSEIKTTLRLGPSDRLFLHAREELVAELPKLLTPAASPRVQTHLLSLTAAGDAPAALMKYQWAITLARPEGELRVEATGGTMIRRAEGKVLVTKANQLIEKAGREGGSKVYNPRDSKHHTKVWESPGPKTKAKPEAAPAQGTPVPAP
jgi:hypothetical protein